MHTVMNRPCIDYTHAKIAKISIHTVASNIYIFQLVDSIVLIAKKYIVVHLGLHCNKSEGNITNEWGVAYNGF